jgi:hypothetical protein
MALGAIAGGILVLTVRTSILRALGSSLVVDERLAYAEVVLVPAWTDEAGLLEAADLVHRRLAPGVALIIGRPGPASAELMKRGITSSGESWRARLVRDLGVAKVEEITVPEDGTDAEGPVMAAWLSQHGFRKAIVVSTADHSRRLRRILDRSSKHQALELIVHVARFSTFHPDRWWQTRTGWRIALVEFEKLALDVVLHPFPGY